MRSYIIVDLRPILLSFSKTASWYPLYNVFPLKDIIGHILSLSNYLDSFEHIYFEIENRLDSKQVNDTFELDNLDLFMEALIHDVDSTIENKTGDPDILENYTFDRWIDETAVILIKESS